MHAHSDCAVEVRGTKEEFNLIIDVLDAFFKKEDFIVGLKNAFVETGTIEICETYELTSVDDVSRLAMKMAEASPNASFTISGVVDTSESAGEYMNFKMDYSNQELRILASDWYLCSDVQENMSYEEYCDEYDSDYSEEDFEKLKQGWFIIESRGGDTVVETVPLNHFELIVLRKGSDGVLVWEQANDEREKLSSLDDELLGIEWSDNEETVEKMIYCQANDYHCSKSDEELSGVWKTEVLKNGSLCLLQYNGQEEVIEVPEKIEGRKVSEIGDYAFSPKQNRISKNVRESRTHIKRVLMGDSVKKIGQGIFEGCGELEEVMLSNTIKALPDSAFNGCKKLKYVIIPNSVTRIGGYVFRECEALLWAYLPDSIKTMRWFKASGGADSVVTFGGCKSLKKVRLPNEIKKLHSMDFIGCESLEEVLLPKTLISIGHAVFSGCSSLSSITLPEGLETLGYEAFGNCDSLKELVIPRSVKKIDKDAFINSNVRLISKQE